MANKAQFYCQLSVLDTPELAGEMQAWSVRAGVPLTTMLRESLRRGWPSVRKDLVAEHGTLTPRERHEGVLRALPPARRPAYALKHGLDVPEDGRIRVAAGAE